ncbi:MAG TPA: tyrosine-type recombinase/integrase, partial [Xanthobacteraceae bacterium]|nr:tyrosine-type recombinase/integrase [Xanthobacteraceae bacterium]
MSVRKRTWKSPTGEPKEAWVVDYVDQHGDRHLKTFAKKRDADAHHAIVGTAVRAGVHTADSKSVTVTKAAELWLESCEAAGLERATIAAYRQHADLHIAPILGTLRLSQLTVPLVRGFEDRLRQDGRSPAMVRNARRSLGAILADAQERGLVAQNVVYSLRKRQRSRRVEGNGKLNAGIDIPAPAEMRAIVGKLNPTTGRYRVLLLTAIFTGLRASELRGLRWDDVDLKRGELHVRQRADRYGAIGRPKSEASERTVPLPPMVVAALREHRLASARSALGLVFPNIRGGIEHRNSIVKCGFHPAQIAAGVVDQHGGAKYKGLHSLRHFYASWCINRRVDGGLELPLKLVSERLGHSTVQLTADTYGHLFPRGDDG